MPEYEFKTKPYDHQREIFLATREIEGYGIFWEMGTGKTKLSIDTVAWLYQQKQINGLLVIAPKGVHEIWPEEFKIHCPNPVMEHAKFLTYLSHRASTQWHKTEMKEFMAPGEGLKVLSISYDGLKTKLGRLLAKEFLKRNQVMEILDESGRIKTPNSKITKHFVQPHRTLARFRRILDGTPISNSPFDIYSPVRFINDQFWRDKGLFDYQDFKAYFGEYGVGWRSTPMGPKKFSLLEGYKRMPLLKEWIAEVGSRVLKDDVLDLPPKIFRTPYKYDLAPEQQRVYDEMDQEFEATLESGVTLEEEIVLTKLIRLQQIMCGFVGDSYGNLHRICKKNPRLDLFKEVTRDIGNQMIIWSHFVPCIEDIVGVLGKRCVAYYGGVTDKQRKINKQRFIDGDVQFLVANPAAAARGHTFVNCHSVLFYSNSYVLDDRLQAEDRCHRSGQTKSVDYGDICSRNTREIEIITSLQKKLKVASFLMGDKVAVERW